MAFDYARLKQTADRLITSASQGVVTIGRVVVTPGATEYDPPSRSVTETVIKAVARGVSSKYVDNATVLMTDLEIIASVDDYVPLTGDVITVDSRPVTLIAHMKIPAAGLTVAHRFIVRA